MRLQASFLWKGLFSIGVPFLILAGLPSSAEDAGTLYNTTYDILQGERYFERQFDS